MSHPTIPEIHPDEVIDFMNVDPTDFGSFTRTEQIRHLEVEGYVVLPDMLNADHIARLKADLADVDLEQTADVQRFNILAHRDRLDDEATVGLTSNQSLALEAIERFASIIEGGPV